MRKTLVRFFTIADYEEEEAWLRERHREGWRLARTIVPCFYIFERCAPEDVVYRLDYKNNAQDAEYMQMLRDFGWEYFNACMGWLYFRKSASEIGANGEDELFSDASSKLEMVRHIIRTRMLPILIIFLTCTLPSCVRAMNGVFGSPSLIVFALFFAPLVLCLWVFLHCGVKLYRLKRKYEER